jgi:hypothetical protein
MTMAIGQKRLEHLEMKIFNESAAAAKRFKLFEAPPDAKIAA